MHDHVVQIKVTLRSWGRYSRWPNMAAAVSSRISNALTPSSRLGYIDCARKYVANLSHTLDILDPIYAWMATAVRDVWVTNVSVTGYKKEGSRRRRAWVSLPRPTIIIAKLVLLSECCTMTSKQYHAEGAVLSLVHACTYVASNPFDNSRKTGELLLCSSL